MLLWRLPCAWGGMAALLGAVFLVLGSASGADDAEPESSGEELLKRAFHNLYAEDYIQTMELSTRPRGGRGMTRRLQITRKQSLDPGKALLRFLAPYEIRRTSVLILENDGASDDLFVYLPASGLTRRLSSTQRADSFFGTDLSYEDVEPKHIDDYTVTRSGEGELNGSPCALLEIHARPSFESTYEKMISCIEVRRGVILWTDFYRRGSVVKRLEVDPHDVRQVGARHIPFTMTMMTPRRRSETRVATLEYQISPEIPDTLFTTWNLESGDADRDRARAGGTQDDR